MQKQKKKKKHLNYQLIEPIFYFFCSCGMDVKILRFTARRISEEDESKEYEFEYIINCHLADNGISVFKSSGQNSGMLLSVNIAEKIASQNCQNIRYRIL